MEDRDIEIEKLKKELANLKKDPRELILASRIREREEEYQHRLLELELASEGIIPVGIAPEAKAHGGKEFTALMKEVEVDEILPVAEKVHKDGYAIIQDFLTKDELEVVRKKMAPFFERTATLFKASDNDRHEGKQTTHIHNILTKSDCADPIASLPRLRAVISSLLGHDFILNAGAVAMAPDPGCAPQGLHRDDGFYALIPRPHMPLVITVAIALDDFTKENGATGLIPGSCLWDEERKPLEEEIIQAEMAAGSILIWDGATYHRGGANRSMTTRRTLTLNYTRGWLRTQFNQYLSIPRDRILEMPPALQADLGYHRSALGLGGCDYQDPLGFVTRLQETGGDGKQDLLGPELRKA